MRRRVRIGLVSLVATAALLLGGVSLAQPSDSGWWLHCVGERPNIVCSEEEPPTTTVVTTETQPAETVTVTAPTTTEEEPPPPSSEGTTIVTSAAWVCNRPLSAYGDLPVTVRQTMANAGSGDGIILERGCAGDGNPATIDLILDQAGNGADVGPGGDGLKVRMAGSGALPHDIDVTGRINCGATQGGAHQDGAQVMTGERLRFVGLVSGDPDARIGTCWGSGGVLFYSGTGSPVDSVCEGCRLVTRGNATLGIGRSIRSGARDSCFYNGRASATISGATDPVNERNAWVQPGQPDPCA